MRPGDPFKTPHSTPQIVTSQAEPPPPIIRRPRFRADEQTFREVVLALRAQESYEQHGGWTLDGISRFFDAPALDLLPFVHGLVTEGIVKWQLTPRQALESSALDFMIKEWMADVQPLLSATPDKDDASRLIVLGMVSEVFTEKFGRSLKFRETDCPPKWMWFRYPRDEEQRRSHIHHAKYFPTIGPRDVEDILAEIAREHPQRWAGVTPSDLVDTFALDSDRVDEMETLLEWMVDQKGLWEIEVARDLSQTRYRTRGARTTNRSGPAGVYFAMTRGGERDGSWSANELAKALEVETSTVLFQLKKLAAADLVRKHGPGDYRRTDKSPTRALLNILATTRPEPRMKVEALVEAASSLPMWPDLKSAGDATLKAFIDSLDRRYVRIERTETTSGASANPDDTVVLETRAWWKLERCPACAHPWGQDRLILDASDKKGVDGRWDPPTHAQCPKTPPPFGSLEPLRDTPTMNDLAYSAECASCRTNLREKQDVAPVTLWDLEAAGAWPRRVVDSAEARVVRTLRDLATAASALDSSALEGARPHDALRIAFEQQVTARERAHALRTIGRYLETVDLTDELHAREWVDVIHDAAALIERNRGSVYLGAFHRDRPYPSKERRIERALELVDQAQDARFHRSTRIEVVHRDGRFHHPACAQAPEGHR